MGRSLVVAVLAVVGLLCAAGIGFAAYYVSRDSVAVPVTRLQLKPQGLAPARVETTTVTTRTTRTTPTTTRATTTRATTTDDHGGRSGGGGGSDHSGRGGGGGGDD
ncbi:MAG TPA: hypothetical protein VHQ98_04575 [Gaiellaceae bacterium]|jgi:hypothetical protein|nr:hypothetical protein [Gaiellaceae bacterium]